MGTTIYRQDLEDMFDDMLDEQGAIKVAGIEFYPSQILKNCDPICYRLSVDEYADFLREEGNDVEE